MRHRYLLLLTALAVSLAGLLSLTAVLPAAETASPFSLVYSTSSDHSAPMALDGATVRSGIYPFTTPDAGVEDVTFYLDGKQVRTEDNPPFDFAGGNSTTANPWDTTRVADGEHTIVAALRLSDGTTVQVQATFTVANQAPAEEPPATATVPADADQSTATAEETPDDGAAEAAVTAYSLVYSLSANRAAPQVLDGATVSGDVYVFTTPNEGVTGARFLLDGTATRQEGSPPFDFAGGDSNLANPWHTTNVADGQHTIKAVLTRADGSRLSISATFTVSNTSAEEPPDDPTPTPPDEEDPTPTPPDEEDPTPEPPPTGGSGSNQVTLVDSYVLPMRDDFKGGYNLVRYQPRQFVKGAKVNYNHTATDVGPYSGWDMVAFPTNEELYRLALDDFLTVRLNRSAQMAVIWIDRASPPRWLASWPQAGTVMIDGKSARVFKRSVSAGDITLGTVWDESDGSANHLGPIKREPYLLIIGEANGQASPQPAVPAGKTVPQPNQTCPAWVHDQYVTQGPDGRMYATWHPQIDPVFWCYFRHDHGTNPATFGNGSYKPPFGYAAYHHGMTEPHAGFKVFVGDFNGTKEFMFVVHMGSAGLGRYCARFHTMDFAAWDGSKIVAKTYAIGDFGRAVFNRTGEPFRPVACPEQANITGSLGERRLPSAHNRVSYEPWRVDASKLKLLGFEGATIGFWTQDGMVIANDLTVSKAVTLPDKNDADHQIQDFHKVVFKSPGHAGTFYTDPMGMEFVSSSSGHAVQQYVAAGVSLNFDGVAKCRDIVGWGRQLTCHVENPLDGNEQREESLGPEYYGSVGYLN